MKDMTIATKGLREGDNGGKYPKSILRSWRQPQNLLLAFLMTTLTSGVWFGSFYVGFSPPQAQANSVETYITQKEFEKAIELENARHALEKEQYKSLIDQTARKVVEEYDQKQKERFDSIKELITTLHRK